MKLKSLPSHFIKHRLYSDRVQKRFIFHCLITFKVHNGLTVKGISFEPYFLVPSSPKSKKAFTKRSKNKQTG